MVDRRFESSFSAIAGELDTYGLEDKFSNFEEEEESFNIDKSEEKRGKIALEMLNNDYFETSLGRS